MIDVELIKNQVLEADKRKLFVERFISETVILAGTTAFLFLLGFLWLDGWMSFYGVPVWVLDCPSYTFLVYSITPVMTVAGWGLWGFFCIYCFGVVLVLVNALFPGVRAGLKAPLKRGEPKKARSEIEAVLEAVAPWGLRFSYLMLCIAVFAIVPLAAIRLGQNYAKDQYDHGTPVHLIFNANVLKSLDAKLTKANDNGNLRFVTQTKDLIVVFVKPGSQPDKPKRVFIFRRADLSLVQWCSPSNDQACDSHWMDF